MPERCGYGGNDLGYQSIEVCVGWPGDAKVFSGQVIDCLLKVQLMSLTKLSMIDVEI